MVGRAWTEVAWAKAHGGHWVAAPLDDYVGRAVFYTGELDRKITWICSRVVREGDTVLDIGAKSRTSVESYIYLYAA